MFERSEHKIANFENVRDGSESQNCSNKQHVMWPQLSVLYQSAMYSPFKKFEDTLFSIIINHDKTPQVFCITLLICLLLH